MTATLKLEVNTSDYAQWSDGNDLSRAVKNLVPKRDSVEGTEKDKSSYKLMMAVVGAHVFALSLLITAKSSVNEPEKLPVTMMVSLVSNPAPQPELKSVEPTIAKPVVKQQQSLLKQKILPTPEPARELAAEETSEKNVVLDQPVAKDIPSELIKSETAKTTEQVPDAVTAPVKAEAEPAIEPPKFGAAYLNNPAPAYPPMARRMGEQGRVLLKVLVSESGNAEKVQIENSSGYNKLDQAAIEAVKQWTFVPAKRSNQAISAYVLVPIKFSLNS